jgi:hypothetical protein
LAHKTRRVQEFLEAHPSVEIVRGFVGRQFASVDRASKILRHPDAYGRRSEQGHRLHVCEAAREARSLPQATSHVSAESTPTSRSRVFRAISSRFLPFPPLARGVKGLAIAGVDLHLAFSRMVFPRFTIGRLPTLRRFSLQALWIAPPRASSLSLAS